MSKKSTKNIKMMALIGLVLVSAEASAAQGGMLTDMLTSISNLIGLSQTTVLKALGFIGVIMAGGGVIALRTGAANSNGGKGAAAGSIAIGLVLMYFAFMVTGTASELGIDSASNTAVQQLDVVIG